MADMKVSFEAMSRESGSLDATADTIEDRVRAARRETADVLGSGWSGGASRAFEREFEQWALAADDAVAALRGLASSLRATGASFRENEESTQSRARVLEAQVPTAGLPLVDIMGGTR